MAYSIIIREKVVALRKRGYSFNELHDEFGISKSTLSVWLREIKLPIAAVQRLDRVVRKGRVLAAETNKKRVRNIIDTFLKQAENDLGNIKLDVKLARLLCALIYYCEGRKSLYDAVGFINSDPRLIKTFLHLFRSGFDIDEKKFRVCIHLHEYHDSKKILRFWSRVTHIPLSQFMRPYKKPNTGKRVRKGYNGCAAIIYYDVNMTRELLMVTEAFLRKHNGPIG